MSHHRGAPVPHTSATANGVAPPSRIPRAHSGRQAKAPAPTPAPAAAAATETAAAAAAGNGMES
eukprot:scaffold239881_cov12-Tisochrysis_lutea.AAC.1